MPARGPEIDARLSLEPPTRPMPTPRTVVPRAFSALAEKIPFSTSMNRVYEPGPRAVGP